MLGADVTQGQRTDLTPPRVEELDESDAAKHRYRQIARYWDDVRDYILRARRRDDVRQSRILKLIERTGVRRVTASKIRRQKLPDGGVYQGDALAIADQNLKSSSVPLIFTDPPYHDKHLGVYEVLGQIASRVLIDGGSLITYTAHHRLPEVIDTLRDRGLTFFWPLAMVHTGRKAMMREYGIRVHWKPLLWFVRGTFRDRDRMSVLADLVESEPGKDAHPWQQGVPEAAYYIEKLTRPGELVFDPFCGGGTTAVAAKQIARRWLTCDIDDDAVQIARKRIAETEVNGAA